MSGPNPKIASLSVTTLAVGAAQVGTLFVALSEQTATGGPRLDRFLGFIIIIGALWTAVALVDLFRFPTMRMTRLIAGPAFTTAVVIVAFQAVFLLVMAMIGDSAGGLPNQLAGLGTSFIGYWALTSLWSLLREPKASNPAPTSLEHTTQPVPTPR